MHSFLSNCSFEEVLAFEQNNAFNSRFREETWNMRSSSDEQMPICYLVLCPPHEVLRRYVLCPVYSI